MKLYTSAASPFGARIAIALRLKGIAIDEVPLPAGGLHSAEFMALNPIAKVPVLITDASTVIPESTAILGYLEDRFPHPALRPHDADDRARVDRVIRIVDTYVMAPVIRLFPHLKNPDADANAAEVARWREGMAALAHFLDAPLPTADAGLSLADCVLPPSLHLSTRIAAMLDRPDPVEPHAALVQYQRGMALHGVVGPVLDRLTAAQASQDAAAGRPSVAHRHARAPSNDFQSERQEKAST